MATLMLVDGNSVTYRAFFALPTDIALASGQITNAVYGFTSMLLNMVRDHHPDTIVVAFDRPEPTFRHDRYDLYKTGRSAAPDILREQMGLVRQVIETLDIPWVELAGYEADDIIATLATQGRDRGDQVLVVTGDRDVYQLVEDPLVRVLYMRRGVSDAADYDEAGIVEKAGVPPSMYPQYAALRGDPSDALPGVPGVGEKTAAKLLTTYGSLDGIFEHLEEQSPKLRENLAASEAQVRLNHELSILDREAPVDIDLDDVRPPAFDREAVRKLFDFLEFRTLHDRFAEAFPSSGGTGAAPGGADVIEAEVSEVATAPDAAALLAGLTGSVALAAAWTGAEGRSPLEGIAVVTGPEAAEVAWIPVDLLADPAVKDAFAALPAVAAHGAKSVLRCLAGLDIALPPVAIDTQIAAYLLDPAESRYLLDELLVRYAALRLPDEGAGGAAAAGQLDLDGGTVPTSL
ncbi:MAG: DNA polymerase I, partial [Acidimicrobiia bacterium]|nr:DNA polymerase I [Acidimicrobiia bacterium]